MHSIPIYDVSQHRYVAPATAPVQTAVTCTVRPSPNFDMPTQLFYLETGVTDNDGNHQQDVGPTETWDQANDRLTVVREQHLSKGFTRARSMYRHLVHGGRCPAFRDAHLRQATSDEIQEPQRIWERSPSAVCWFPEAYSFDVRILRPGHTDPLPPPTPGNAATWWAHGHLRLEVDAATCAGARALRIDPDLWTHLEQRLPPDTALLGSLSQSGLLTVLDVPTLAGRDQTAVPWHARRASLKRLVDTTHISLDLPEGQIPAGARMAITRSLRHLAAGQMDERTSHDVEWWTGNQTGPLVRTRAWTDPAAAAYWHAHNATAPG